MEGSLNQVEFEVLHYLDIYHAVSELEDVREALSRERDEIETALRALENREYVEDQWRITSEGETTVEAVRERRVQELEQTEAFLEQCRRFEDINTEFKDLITEYQTRSAETLPGETAPPLPMEELEQLHDELEDIVAEVADLLPQFQRYGEQFESAMAALREGKEEYLVRHPESYHDVWHEFHESLLKFSGRTREE